MPNDASIHLDFAHRLRFECGVFAPGSVILRDLMGNTEDGENRAQVFLDSGVDATHPEIRSNIRRWADASGVMLAGEMSIVPGGETCKNDPSVLESILRTLHDAKLCRRSYAIVIGGGAALDVVGYAASIVHRGIRLIRVPSTTLSQCDSGVGVKNGVNAFGKKNYLGTFAVPWAVVNDEALLTTLSNEDWIGGFSEVVKVALLKAPSLFEMVESSAPQVLARDHEASVPLIRRSAELHLAHICEGGDPYELTEARPLDFGHWSAHKLEQMTDFELSHGRAVAIGLALDVSYANAIGLLDDVTTERVLVALESLGFALSHPALERTDELLAGLDEFREHLGGRLTVTLIDSIGSQRDVHEVDTGVMAACATELAHRTSAQPVR